MTAVTTLRVLAAFGVLAGTFAAASIVGAAAVIAWERWRGGWR